MGSATAGGAIAGPLLRFLRAELVSESLTFAEPPSQITGGFDTMVYSFQLLDAPPDWARPLILRVFRPDSAPDQASFEAAVQNNIASLDYPAPRVLASTDNQDALGRAFTIMERVPGELMVQRIVRPSRGWLSLPRTLAELHGQLHALDAPAFVAALAREGLPASRAAARVDTSLIEREINRLSLNGLQPGMRWVIDNQPLPRDRKSICHGDFHPLNILMTGRAVSGVIDWSWTAVADPAYDIGATVAIFAQGPIDLPAFLRPIADFVRKCFIKDYLRSYASSFPIDLDAVRYYEALRTLGFLVEASEHILAEAGRLPMSSKPSAFTAPYVVRSITQRFADITGLSLAPPTVSN